jgi:DNA-binding response OmpR family regulator
MRIAYLEDDPDQAALIRRWIETAGHACHHFGRGLALTVSQCQAPSDACTMLQVSTTKA